MKLETHIKESIEINVKKKKEVEHLLQGKIKPKNGHSVWEINEKTNEIKKAEFARSTVVFSATLPPKS